MILPLILGLSTWELIAIVAVILLLFGAKRIPSILRNIGQGVNSFKKGVTELQDEIENGTESSESNYKGSEENK